MLKPKKNDKHLKECRFLRLALGFSVHSSLFTRVGNVWLAVWLANCYGRADFTDGQIAHRRIVAGWEILRNHGRNNNSLGSRQKYGFRVRLLQRNELAQTFLLHAPCAIVNEDAAEINPLRLTFALIRGAEKKGLKICDHTKVKDYRRRGTILGT